MIIYKGIFTYMHKNVTYKHKNV